MRDPDSCLKVGPRHLCAWVLTPFFCSYLWRFVFQPVSDALPKIYNLFAATEGSVARFTPILNN